MPPSLYALTLALILTAAMLLDSPASAQAVAQRDAGDLGCSGRADSPQHRHSADELHELGARRFEYRIAHTGLVTDRPDWTAMVDEVMVDLLRAAAFTHAGVRHAIFATDDFEAWASVGNYIGLSRGALNLLEDAAREVHPNSPEAAKKTLRAMVAGVLAHEIAHLTLGHPGSMVERQMVSSEAGTAIREESRAYTESELDHISTAGYSRACESDADMVGALYLARAGYEIQGIIDFFFLFNRWREAESPSAASYFSSHPHSIDRAADVEQFRANLRRHQRRYEDALVYVRTNQNLDQALTLLDEILDDFPDLHPARQLRGTVLHRKWLNTVPVQDQLLRASLATVTRGFDGGIRSPDGPELALLRAAAVEYDKVLAVTAMPEALSNRALLHAYEGQREAARAAASRARTLRPDDPSIANNYGVVLFLIDDYQGAIDVFRNLMATPAGRATDHATLNLGLALYYMGEDAEAYEVLRSHHAASRGQMTSWGQYAEYILANSPYGMAAGGAGALIACEPTLRGVGLMDSLELIIERFGEGVAYQQGGEILLVFPDDGVMVASDHSLTVGAWRLFGDSSDSTCDLSIGNRVSSVTATLGEPADRDFDAGIDALWYLGSTYDLVLLAEDGVVIDITVAYDGSTH